MKKLTLNTKALKLKLEVLKCIESTDVKDVVGGNLPETIVGV